MGSSPEKVSSNRTMGPEAGEYLKGDAVHNFKLSIMDD